MQWSSCVDGGRASSSPPVEWSGDDSSFAFANSILSFYVITTNITESQCYSTKPLGEKAGEQSFAITRRESSWSSCSKRKNHKETKSFEVSNISILKGKANQRG